jgi:hypothetical protein
MSELSGEALRQNPTTSPTLTGDYKKRTDPPLRPAEPPIGQVLPVRCCYYFKQWILQWKLPPPSGSPFILWSFKYCFPPSQHRKPFTERKLQNRCFISVSVIHRYLKAVSGLINILPNSLQSQAAVPVTRQAF